MKIISLIVLFGIIQSTRQFSFLSNSVEKASEILSTNDELNTCKGNLRRWSLCYGTSPAVRTTTDSCPKKTEECSSGTLEASKFISRFTLSKIPLSLDVHPLLRRKRQIPSFTPKRDLLFMIDGSGSAGSNQFGHAKSIVSSTIRLLCKSQAISPNKTRVAVMSFDSVNRLHVPLLHPTMPELNSNAEVLANYTKRHVNYNSTTSGSTCLNKALLYARDVALNTSGSRRGETHVLQEIIILTDGCANCGGSNSIQSTVNALDAIGIKIYVIGIGLTSSCKYMLKILASRGNCYHFFYLDRWDYDLNDLVESLKRPTVVNGSPFCLHQLIGSVNLCTPPNQQG